MMFLLMTISDEGRSFFGKIYDKHYKRMLYTATQILGREQGEDAVNDVFVRLLEKFENIFEDLADKPARFFVIVVKNYSLDILKKERNNMVSLDDELTYDDIPCSASDGPEETALANDAVERLAGYIRKLSPMMREAFEYRYIAGYSNTEIAEALGVSQSVVSTRLDSARKRLKRML